MNDFSVKLCMFNYLEVDFSTLKLLFLKSFAQVMLLISVTFHRWTCTLLNGYP